MHGLNSYFGDTASFDLSPEARRSVTGDIADLAARFVYSDCVWMEVFVWLGNEADRKAKLVLRFNNALLGLGLAIVHEHPESLAPRVGPPVSPPPGDHRLRQDRDCSQGG